MIDYEIFDSTYSDFGSEMINEIIDIYLSEQPNRLNILSRNIKELDFEAINKNAHSLKGSTSVLYDNEVTELARQLEQKAKDKNQDGIMELFDNLKKEVDRLANDLVQLKRKYS
jgi:HPt (histidine-containing phosphotransfer) domain-containing protein